MKTEADINDLKARWFDDPIWDIEKTEGFEAHESELLKFSDDAHCILTLSKHVVGTRIKMPEYEPFFAEHIGVFEMMMKRDEEGLRKAMRDHVRGSQPNVQARAAYIREHYQPDDYRFIT